MKEHRISMMDFVTIDRNTSQEYIMSVLVEKGFDPNVEVTTFTDKQTGEVVFQQKEIV